MMKKKRTPKESPLPSSVEKYTVGDGLTKWEAVDITGLQNPSSEAIAELFAQFERIGKVSTFNGRVQFAVKWAQTVIDRDGLPKSITESNAERNVTERWYAAEILSDAGRLGRMVSRIQADPEAARKEADALAMFAFELGLLVYEAIGFKFPYEALTIRGIRHDKGSRSAKPPRRSLPLAQYIAFRRRDPDLNFADFCDELSTVDEDDPIVHNGTEIWCKKNRIIVDAGGNKPKSFSFRTLERYWNTPPTRAK